jgi:aspartate/methionine/tyrosine aminotransferase
MFSTRAAWDLRPNRLATLVEERRRAALPIADLTESNPTRVGLDYPEERILEALRPRAALAYEPLPAGHPAARAAVAAYYARAGFAADPARICLCASTSEGYTWLFKLLCDPGAEVLVPAPCYPLFGFLAALESVRLQGYPLVYEPGVAGGGRWNIDLDAVRAAVSPRTAAIVVVNPNNPTGSFLRRDERNALAEIARASDLALVSDEVFADYAARPDPARVPFAAAHDDVLSFSLSGLSKIAALPQLKLGWIVTGGPPTARDAALARLEVIADTFLSVGTPVQHAAAALLDVAPGLQRQIRARTGENRAALAAALAAAPAATLLDAEGGWSAVVRFPRTLSEEELSCALLAEDGVLVHPGYFFDFPGDGYLVVSLLPECEAFAAAAGRVAGRIARL